jgi:hypothetical protein
MGPPSLNKTDESDAPWQDRQRLDLNRHAVCGQLLAVLHMAVLLSA